MRELSYLSPTSIGTWLEDRDEFYLRYLAENRPPRPPQTLPMAVGSAFDAYVKAALHKALDLPYNSAYELEALFEAQVETQNRDWAWENGKHVFDSYVALGAYDSVLTLLRRSETTPRFEFELRAPVSHQGKTVVFLGRPDLAVTLCGKNVVYDWKCNGYMGKYATSPQPGFVNIFGGRSKGPHKDARLVDVCGVQVNEASSLESKKPDWARQLSIYNWCLGSPVGDDFVTGIDQLVAKPIPGEKPEIRVAQHRYRIGPMFQATLFNVAVSVWEAIQKDHIFTDVSFEDDKRRRKALDEMAGAFDATNEHDRMFLALTR